MATNISIFRPTDIKFSATTNFDGNAPTGALTTSNGRFIWAPSTSQGLFAPWNWGVLDSIRVVRVQLLMSGQTTWKVELLTGGGGSTGYTANTIAVGTTEASWSMTDVCILDYGQALRVTTTGAGTTSVNAILTVASINYSTYVMSSGIVTANSASTTLSSLNSPLSLIGTITSTGTATNNNNTASAFYNTGSGLAGMTVTIQPDQACYVAVGTTNAAAATANDVQLQAGEKLTYVMGPTQGWISVLGANGVQVNARVYAHISK